MAGRLDKRRHRLETGALSWRTGRRPTGNQYTGAAPGTDRPAVERLELVVADPIGASKMS
jgi:hypothetical protein